MLLFNYIYIVQRLITVEIEKVLLIIFKNLDFYILKVHNLAFENVYVLNSFIKYVDYF